MCARAIGLAMVMIAAQASIAGLALGQQNKEKDLEASASIYVRPTEHDQTEEINAALSALSQRGGGTVRFGSGTYRISGIVPLSDVAVQGVSQSTTKLSCGSDHCITQSPGTQLSNFRMSDVRIEPQNESWATGTAITFFSIQQSYIERISIKGFANGTALRLGGIRAIKLDRPELGGNVIWNHFRDLTVFGCGECIVLSGSYGQKPTNSPINSANEPDQVITANVFDNVNLMNVKKVGWNIVSATDTNTWIGGLVNLAASNAIGVIQGGDRNYEGNTYANSNKFFGIAFSKAREAKNVMLFSSFNFTFGLEAYGVETDILQKDNGEPPPWSLEKALSYRICGRSLGNAESLTVSCLER